MSPRKAKPKKIKLTQVKSAIGYRQRAKDTIRCLGFRKLNQTVVHSDTPIIRGMVKKINFLLKVEESS